METRKTKLGADHPDTLSSMSQPGSDVPRSRTMGGSGRARCAGDGDSQDRSSEPTIPIRCPVWPTWQRRTENQGRWEEAEELEVQVTGDEHDKAWSRPSRYAV